MANKKDQDGKITEAGAVELEETELDDVQGGLTLSSLSVSDTSYKLDVSDTSLKIGELDANKLSTDTYKISTFSTDTIKK